MKNRLNYFCISLILILSAALSFAENAPLPAGASENQEVQELNPRTGFPEIGDKPFVLFNEGLSFAMVNRLEFNDDSANFVREDYMLGAYFGIQTVNMAPINSVLQASVYYPVYHTFNGMKQNAKQVLLYAADLYFAPLFEGDMWKYVRINFGPGVHYMYQLTDEYHMHYLGLGAQINIELPLAKHWTIEVNGLATLDYPNLGSNRNVQKFNLSYQYHFDLGVRYSRKKPNQYCYIKGKQL